MACDVDARPPLAGTGARLLEAFATRLEAWRRTREARRRLLHFCALDPRLARDIGLTATDIAVERRAPFWVPVGARRAGRTGRGSNAPGE